MHSNKETKVKEREKAEPTESDSWAYCAAPPAAMAAALAFWRS